VSGRGALILAVIATFILSLLYVRSRFLVVELSYEVSQRQQRKVELEQERRALVLELATLRDPKRMERIASQAFGLERPTGMESVVFVNGGSSDLP
jgi:cell division protein FtsL